MEDLLYKYMSQRFSDKKPDSQKMVNGPLLTISRAAGCTVSELANRLTGNLNDQENAQEWEVISKEILHHSAEILNLHPDKIKRVFEPKNRNLFDEVVQAFISGDYQLEKKMLKTVTNVIHKFGAEGHKIIIGRAANIICSDIPNSLHIRIEAPLQWQIERIEKIKMMTREEATNYINTTEKNRENFRKAIKGNDQILQYDMIINQATFTTEQISEIILHAMKTKKII